MPAATTRPSASASGAALTTIALCMLASMIEGLDIQSAGVAAPRMAAEFHLDPAELGNVLAASPLGLLLGAALGGRLADRAGRKRMLIASMIVYGACSILTAVSHGYSHLLGARLLCGVGLGGALPNLIALTAEAVHVARRNTLVSVMAAGMPIGGMASSLVALGWPAAADWRAIFYAGGAAPLLLAPFMAVGLRESHRFEQHRDAPDRTPGILRALFADRRAPGTLLAGTSFFCVFLILYLLQNWLPSLMVARGFTARDAFLIQGAFNVGGAAGAILLGWLMDGPRRSAIVAIAYGAMALSLGALGSLAPRLGDALLLALLAGVFVIGSQLVQYGLTSGLYATPFRGTGVGFAVALGRLGSIVGPLGAAALLQAGTSASHVLTALLPVVLVGGIAAYGVARRPPVDD